MEKDLKDLVNYCKQLTDELLTYKEKVRDADRIMNDLKRSGADNVESLLRVMTEQCKYKKFIYRKFWGQP
jgi:hypothetical protein